MQNIGLKVRQMCVETCNSIVDKQFLDGNYMFICITKKHKGRSNMNI
jgi:hypothetical protein